MGVTGLWKLIEQSGKPVPLETLENKILAIDISIWLHQVIKGYQDAKGNQLPNAHILGLFHRLCKLLFYRIRPIFVFDGGVPQLKIQTIKKRNQSKNKFIQEADRIQSLLLKSLAQEKIVQQALGADAEKLISPKKQVSAEKESARDDIFKLPPPKDESFNASSSSLDDSSSSWDEKSTKLFYNLNLNAIDVTSKHFKGLPADVRHDILTDIKETRKQSSWGRLHELPAQSDDFSEFQMKKLLKRRKVQEELEEAEKEMGGKCMSLAELEALLTEEGIDVSSVKNAAPIASSEHNKMLMIRDVQKAIEKAKKEDAKKLNEPSTSKKTDDHDDLDLQAAIKLSLMDGEELYAMPEEDETEIMLSKEQKKHLSEAAKSLARGYMLEYGGMTNEDVNDLLAQHNNDEDLDQTMKEMFQYNDISILKGKEVDEKAEEIHKNDAVSVSSSTDSDFVDVPDDDSDINDDIHHNIGALNSVFHQKPILNGNVEVTLDDIKRIENKKPLEIVVRKDKIVEDDIFADIFAPPGENIKEVILIDEETDKKDSMEDRKHAVTPDGLFPICEEDEDEDENANKSPSRLFPNEECSKNKSPNLSERSVTPDFLFSLEESPEISKMSEMQESNETKSPKRKSPVMHEDRDETKKLKLQETQPKLNVLDDIKNSLKFELENLKDRPINLDNIPVPESNLNDIKSLLEQELSDLKSKTSPIELPVTPRKGTLDQFILSPSPKKKIVEEEILPKIPSPFYVRKTPPSSKKKKDQITERTDYQSSISKSLFPDLDKQARASDVNNEEKTIDKEAKIKEAISLSSKDYAEMYTSELALILKAQKGDSELKQMAADLSLDRREMEAERNKQDRMGASVTEKMQLDCMNLLKLFGIPYLVAPKEAEAQCAFLNAIGLTDGTVTDDSDIWLFGGKTVYKNFFNQKKLVMEFEADSIMKLFNMDRKKLIQLAMLVGSDYTTGINGIGAVTALEILATFPNTPVEKKACNEMMSMLSGLRKFRDWFASGKTIGPGGKTSLKSKLKNIEIFEGFPSSNVVEAYLKPEVDESKEAFVWGHPDDESIREYAKQKFSWTKSRTDEILMPVLKKLEERKSQQSITNYFKIQSAVVRTELKASKRVQKAVNIMSGKIDDDSDEKSPSKRPKRAPRKKKVEDDDIFDAPKPKRAPRKKKVEFEEAGEPQPPKRGRKKASEPIPGPSTSGGAGLLTRINEQSSIDLLGEDGPITRKKLKRVGNKMPDFDPVIPQKVKDQEKNASDKQKAIEAFKKSKAMRKKSAE